MQTLKGKSTAKQNSHCAEKSSDCGKENEELQRDKYLPQDGNQRL